MDRTTNGGFEGITSLLMEQKRIMEALEAENSELRRQLTNLRQGVGISLVIEGKVMPLAPEMAITRSTTAKQKPQDTDQPSTVKTLEEAWEQATQSPLADSFVL